MENLTINKKSVKDEIAELEELLLSPLMQNAKQGTSLFVLKASSEKSLNALKAKEQTEILNNGYSQSLFECLSVFHEDYPELKITVEQINKMVEKDKNIALGAKQISNGTKINTPINSIEFLTITNEKQVFAGGYNAVYKQLGIDIESLKSANGNFKPQASGNPKLREALRDLGYTEMTVNYENGTNIVIDLTK
jgi:hypothetical protein